MEGQITKEQITERSSDFRSWIYNHGGSRIFIDGVSGDTYLLVDTYYDTEFAQYIEKCVRDYFNIPKTITNEH